MSAIFTPLLLLGAAIAIALIGALGVSLVRDSIKAWVSGVGVACITFLCTLLAALAYYISTFTQTAGRTVFTVDELNAPLLPLVALLHLLTALATGRTKMRRFSVSWSLASQAIRLATFSCVEPWILVTLLIVDTLPGYIELANRGQSRRIYALHMGLFSAFLVLGHAFLYSANTPGDVSNWAAVLLLAAILIRCGTIPVHGWLTDWIERASLGNALLFVTPLIGVYAAVRLVLPLAPDWMLSSIGLVSLTTAFYAAGMALVQHDGRRFFAYLFLSHASLVLVGLEIHSSTSLTAALALWMAVSLSLTGFGLTLRALEARVGRISLAGYHGLYEQSPSLGVCFLLTGLASIGFPGTLGFVGSELLVEGALEASSLVALVVVATATLNGIAVIRAYFHLFTGKRHVSTVDLGIGRRERFAVLTLALLILGGGLFPQPGIVSRWRAARILLRQREQPEPRIGAAQRENAREHAMGTRVTSPFIVSASGDGVQ